MISILFHCIALAAFSQTHFLVRAWLTSAHINCSLCNAYLCMCEHDGDSNNSEVAVVEV